MGPKHSRVPSFDGAAAKFDDWAFAFKRTIRSVSREAYELIIRLENETAVDEGDLDMGYGGIDVHAYSAEFYDVMCQACQGEALAVIRTVDDMEGLEAWMKLYKKFKLGESDPISGGGHQSAKGEGNQRRRGHAGQVGRAGQDAEEGFW